MTDKTYIRGMGEWQRRRSIPVTIRGKTYPSMSAAARALGLHHTTIINARKKGTLETVGIKVTRSKAVQINSNRFSSIREAAETYGLSYFALRNLVKLLEETDRAVVAYRGELITLPKGA